MKSKKTSKAYQAGWEDGATWVRENPDQLDKFDTWDDWDEALINAIGVEETRLFFGLRKGYGERAWSRACGDYNRGANDGARAQMKENES